MTKQDITQIPHYINGKKTATADAKSQAVFNPATGEVYAEVVLANKDEVNAAARRSRWTDYLPIQGNVHGVKIGEVVGGDRRKCWNIDGQPKARRVDLNFELYLGCLIVANRRSHCDEVSADIAQVSNAEGVLIQSRLERHKIRQRTKC